MTNSTNYNSVTGSVTVAVSSSGGGGGTPVPVMEGWWLLPGLLAGAGFLTRRRKQ